MPELLIGCPIRSREWILQSWFAHAEQAAAYAGLVPTYLFVIDHRDRSEQMIQDLCAAAGRELRICHVDEDGGRVDVRDWCEARYHHMVWVRNVLLAEVRRLEPTWFLSLDSDILLAEPVLRNLIESADSYDAVGGKCYMTTDGTHCPSCAITVNVYGMLRENTDRVTPVDVIMAIKLMSPDAYAVDYQYHFHGEDLGWSAAVKAKGLKLGWDGRVTSKHVMAPELLDVVDDRCGY